MPILSPASIFLRVAVLLACTAMLPLSAAEFELRLHGSNTVGQALAPALVDSWAVDRGWIGGEWREMAAEEHARQFTRGSDTLNVQIAAHGTGTGLASLIAGKADLWMASRPAKAAELASAKSLGSLDAPEQEHVLALDGLSVIVHDSNPIRTLTVQQVKQLFSGKITNWREVGGKPGAVTLYARDDKSGTFDSFKSMVLGDDALRADTHRFESTSELSGRVAGDQNALGFVGLAGVGKARALALSDAGTRALPPSRFNVATEDYVLSRRLFAYRSARSTALTRDFLEFVHSASAQAAVDRTGFIAQVIAPIALPPRPDAGKEYAALTSTARRLTVNFRFATGASYLDGKALRDLDRLTHYLRSESKGTGDLLLIGFSDANEVNAYQALAMSVDRADYVADQLMRRGVVPRQVRGVGHVAPVASNDSDVGRSRNRRVEIWLRPRSGTSASASSF